MSSHRFTIPGRLPGLNEIVGAARYNRFAAASQKKKATELCAQHVIASRIPAFKGPVALTIDWIEPNNRRDIDNVAAGAKFILDALVSSGRLPNDSRKWVKALTHTFPPADKMNPRVEVALELIEGDKIGLTD